MKKLVLSFVLVFWCGTVFAVDNEPVKPDTSKKLVQGPLAGEKPKTFTVEELKKYNGQNGMPVYVAVNGIVYDLSKVGPWKTGKHMNKHFAGEDLTDAITNKAPEFIHHGGKILEKFPKVGVLVTTQTVTGAVSPVAVAKSDIGKSSVCPVTGDKFKISAATPALKYKDKMYYFCCPGCDGQFKQDPEKYINRPKEKKK